MAKPTAIGNWVRLTLGSLQLFIGLGGVAGGIGLTADPSGLNVGMSTGILAATPFSDFLIPGLVLLAINGLGSLLGSFLTFTHRRFAAKAAMALGAFLIAWIVIQVYWIGHVHWLQPLYLGFGILELALGLLLCRMRAEPDGLPITRKRAL
jgi:hypothetical protein